MRCGATHGRVGADGQVFEIVTCERDEHNPATSPRHVGWSFLIGEHYTWDDPALVIDGDVAEVVLAIGV